MAKRSEIGAGVIADLSGQMAAAVRSGQEQRGGTRVPHGPAFTPGHVLAASGGIAGVEFENAQGRGKLPADSGGLRALGPGDTITYTRGAEKLAPVQYFNVDLGPYSATVTIRDGETGVEALARARAAVDEIYETAGVEQLRAHIERAKKMSGR